MKGLKSFVVCSLIFTCFLFTFSSVKAESVLPDVFFSSLVKIDDVSACIGATQESISDTTGIGYEEIKVNTAYSYLFIYQLPNGKFWHYDPSIQLEDGTIGLEIKSVSDIKDTYFTSYPTDSSYIDTNAGFDRGTLCVLALKDNIMYYLGSYSKMQDFRTLNLEFNKEPVLDVSLSSYSNEVVKADFNYTVDVKFKELEPLNAQANEVTVYKDTELWGTECLNSEVPATNATFYLNIGHKYRFDIVLNSVVYSKEVDLTGSAVPTLVLTQSNGNKEKVSIVASYSSNSNLVSLLPDFKVSSLELYDSGVMINVREVKLDSLEADRTFVVNHNGTYTVKLVTSAGTASQKIIVNTLDDSPIKPWEDADSKESKDAKKPVITFSKFPSEATAGEVIELTMYSNEKAELNFNGQSLVGYRTKLNFCVSCNGTYSYWAVDKSGNIKEGTIKIKFFKSVEERVSTKKITNSSKTGTDSETKLPQTGDTKLIISLVIVLALMIICYVIIYIVKKRRSDKDC